MLQRDWVELVLSGFAKISVTAFVPIRGVVSGFFGTRTTVVRRVVSSSDRLLSTMFTCGMVSRQCHSVQPAAGP